MSYVSDRKNELLSEENEHMKTFIIDSIKKDFDNTVYSDKKIEKKYIYNLTHKPKKMEYNKNSEGYINKFDLFMNIASNVIDTAEVLKNNNNVLKQLETGLFQAKDELIEMGFLNVEVKFPIETYSQLNEGKTKVPIYVRVEWE